jgi:hypothetical protein
MILLNNWEGQTAKDVFTEFDGTRWSAYREDDAIPVEEKPEFKDAEILLASYGTPSYEGYAFVLFRREGKLYEVNGSHCSCYGLEGQWDPEETTVEALRHRVNEGTLGKGDYDENPFAQELLAVLDGIAAAITPAPAPREVEALSNEEVFDLWFAAYSDRPVKERVALTDIPWAEIQQACAAKWGVKLKGDGRG